MLLYLNDFSDQQFPYYQQNVLKSQGKGARVLVHPRGSYPDMSKGFSVPPGNEVLVQLQASVVSTSVYNINIILQISS